jgi:imidazolonepropionase-like amidohydrolase
MRYAFLILAVAMCVSLSAQVTFPHNGPAPKPETVVRAFVNANIITEPGKKLENATLIVRNERIEAVGTDVAVPPNAVVVDLKGKYIYPSFIDLSSDYGMPEMTAADRFDFRPQYQSKRKGSWAWNEAIKSDFRAAESWSHNAKRAEEYRKAGIGAVLTHRQDGIARGTGAVVVLGQNENTDLIVPEATVHFSLRKGSSRQAYPSSLVGAMALLRQTLYDARWYGEQADRTEANLSLAALQGLEKKVLMFEASEKFDILRAGEISREFGLRFICRGNGDEYQSIDALKDANTTLIIPVKFPAPFDVSDPHLTRMISLSEMRHWELAPFNPGLLHQNGIRICLTADGLKDKKEFIPSVIKAIEHGLPEEAALEALTVAPARLVGAAGELGKLYPGFRANFFIASGPVFQAGSEIMEHYTNGRSETYKPLDTDAIAGYYHFTLRGKMYDLNVSGPEEKPKASLQIVEGKDTLKSDVKIQRDGRHIVLTFAMPGSEKGTVRGFGNVNRESLIWDGKAEFPDGSWADWVAVRQNGTKKTEDKPRDGDKAAPMVPELTFPIGAYGRKQVPATANLHIRNGTLWTCEAEGVIEKGDIVISGGKIVAVGPDLNPASFFPKQTLEWTVVEAYGKHVTPGIIDEHSHIALMRGVNEGAQASSAEVRMGDAINPEDVNIYRQLSGGVTAAQLLHGSANPIGGQSALVKMRWGSQNPNAMKIEGADGFIKFALGENVKQANWGDYERERFPQTRMGVEQVYYDHFHRAREYGRAHASAREADSRSRRQQRREGPMPAPRVDLDLEALNEILEKKRFISCHSYVQSEINMLMHVGDSMGFTVNTFTHILEGYKLADKMAKHGAGGSSFSDWWAYKWEVKDAIPHNGAILWQQGVVTAFNSDDAEMARRLNQEAAKAVKYGNVPEAEALKFVTLNPAKLLHLDHRMGSLKAGKDADIVLWSDHPLSIYAKAEKTIVDGRILYDSEENKLMEEQIRAERARLIQRMMETNSGGGPTQKPRGPVQRHYCCDTIEDFLRTEDCRLDVQELVGFE